MSDRKNVGIRSVSTCHILRRMERGYTIPQVARHYNTTVECVRKQLANYERRQKYGTRSDSAIRGMEASPDNIRKLYCGRRNTVHAAVRPVKPGTTTVCGVTIRDTWEIVHPDMKVSCTTCLKGMGELPRKSPEEINMLAKRKTPKG